MAVPTQESIPPLNNTTAFRESLIFTSFSLLLYFVSSNALRRWVPNKLVQLQSQPHCQTIRQDPFRQLAWFEPRPFALWVFKHGRKQNLSHTPRQPVFAREFACEFVIPSRRKHEFRLVVFRELCKIVPVKSIRLARIRAFHVNNLDDILRQPPDEALAARFEHHGVAR